MKVNEAKRAQRAAATDRGGAREGEGEAMAVAQEYDGQRQLQQRKPSDSLTSAEYIATESHRKIVALSHTHI